MLGMQKSSVHRLVMGMVEGGLLVRDPESSRYRLGPKIVALANVVVRSDRLFAILDFHLRDLVQKTSESAYFSVPDRDAVLTVQQVVGPSSITYYESSGWRLPFHCTAVGKAILASMEPEAVARVLSGPLQTYTPKTIQRTEDLHAHLQEVRTRGYATAVDELEEGLATVAAPVFGMSGEVVGAIAIGGPGFRFVPDRLHEFGEIVKATAQRLSDEVALAPGEGFGVPS